MLADPLPLAAVEGLIHGDVDVIVHGQLDGSVKVTVRSPPAESNASDSVLRTGSWQDPASCVTVNEASPI
jgi:hypothetical protein